jgi:RHS repeat-associated protein
MVMPGRSGNSNSYRYGFNGMESDDEVSGEGNSYTTEYRQYDPRLMRWKSRDPMEAYFPWQSPYVAFDNNPIYYTDPKGLAAEGEPEDPPSKGLPSNPKDEQIATGANGKNYQWLEGAGWARDYGDPVDVKQTWWESVKTIGRNAINTVVSVLRKADQLAKGGGDHSGFIKNGAPLVNPGADGSQQGSAIKKTENKEESIDIEWFTVSKGWKVKPPTLTTPKDYIKNIRKIQQRVERIESELEEITEGHKPALGTVDNKDVQVEIYQSFWYHMDKNGSLYSKTRLITTTQDSVEHYRNTEFYEVDTTGMDALRNK